MLNVQSFTFNPVQENTYILYNDNKDCCIIDPGCYFASEEAEIVAFIEKKELNPVYLLNTHCHLDHIFGNRFISQKYNLKLHLHKDEKQLLDLGPTQGQMYQLPFENYEGELIFINENDVIQLGEDRLDIFFTPGHSPGHICFYSRKDGFVIGGDVLFNGSIGRTDLPGGSLDTLENSIRTQLYVLPDEVVVFAGHGETTTIGEEKKSNPFVRG